MKKLLSNVPYRYQATANFISTLGDSFLNTCLAIYVVKSTGSVSLFASILALQNVPQIFLGPIAGTLMDRFNKMAAVVSIDLLRGLFFVLLGLLSQDGNLALPSIYTLVVFEAIMQSFYASAKTSVLPTLLSREALVEANMVDSSIYQISLILGPALSVVILGLSNIHVILLLNGLSFLLAAFLEGMNLVHFGHLFVPKNTVSLKLNLPFELYKNKEILSLSLNGILTHLAILPFFIVGLPYLLLKVYHLSDIQYGFMNSLAMMGTLLSIFTVPWINYRFSDLKALNTGMFGMLTSAFFLFPLSIPSFHTFLLSSPSKSFGYFCIVMIIFHLSFSTYGVFYGSFYQKKVPTSHLGRFTSMLIAGFSLGRVVGTQVYGTLFEHHQILGATLFLMLGMLLKLALNGMTPSAEEVTI